MKHPSALRSFDRMMKAIKGKRIVVFLDYDGTLSPIVNDPDLAIMSKEVNSTVRIETLQFTSLLLHFTLCDIDLSYPLP